MPENQRSCKRIGLFVVVLFGALWQFFDFYTDLKSVVTYKKACSECSGNGTQSTLLGKVSILGVESLLPHSVLERIWVKGSYLSQWLPQGERGPPKESKSRLIEIFHVGSH